MDGYGYAKGSLATIIFFCGFVYLVTLLGLVDVKVNISTSPFEESHIGWEKEYDQVRLMDALIGSSGLIAESQLTNDDLEINNEKIELLDKYYRPKVMEFLRSGEAKDIINAQGIRESILNGKLTLKDF